MGFFIDFLDRIFNRETKEQVFLDDCSAISARAGFKELAINSSINLLGSAVSLSNFETYREGKRINKQDSYLLNVEPNMNTNAARFWRDVIFKMVFYNECLVIKHQEQFFVADSFTVKEYAFYENTYSNVTIKGFNLDRTFTESEVLHFELNERRIVGVLNSLYEDYGKLIEYSKSSYRKNNAKRGILTIPTNYPQTDDAQKKLNALLNERIQKFYEAENGAVLPLTNGITYQDLSSDSYKNATDSRDIKNLADDVFDFVGIGFQIPPQLLKGSVSDLDSVIDAFIGLGVNPLTKIIESEINRKFYGKKGHGDRTFVKVNTQGVMLNIEKLANTLDVLTRNGIHSIDENRELIGEEPLGTEESRKRYVTKNYENGD